MLCKICVKPQGAGCPHPAPLQSLPPTFRAFVGAAYMRPANLPPHPVSPSPPCRGRACPARNLPPNPFHGQSVGEGFIPPGHFPPPQTATAARGLAALQPYLKIRAQGGVPSPCRRIPSRTSLFLHILYKLYRSHTKQGMSLQKLYRDCTAPWSIPARKCGTMALLPVKHCEMHKLYHINLVKRESTHT